jgi:CelD/BcsL family acetyltransferase involved in cellulose biosynthesis
MQSIRKELSYGPTTRRPAAVKDYLSHAGLERAPLSSVTATNPLANPAWDSLLKGNPNGSFFHGAAWARVLTETYGHRPCYFCRVEGDRLVDLLPVMELPRTWGGRRGVSLPFTDSCVPIKSGADGWGDLYTAAMAYGKERHWRFLECRGSVKDWHGSSASLSFLGHWIDLTCGEEALLKSMDPAARRGILKAQRNSVQIDFSAEPEAMLAFYRLHCTNRRRHGVPPQPKRFFENISKWVVGTGRGVVATAYIGDRAVAAAVFFHSGKQAIFKFGALDYAFQSLRPSNLVMWAAIKHYREMGLHTLDLGRTSAMNGGLRRYKLNLGAKEKVIEYARYDFKNQCFVSCVDRAQSWVNPILRRLPGPVFRLVGELIYPHLF